MKRLPNLALIGFMASGKSTIGRRCAWSLGFEFRDTDLEVETAAGKAVSAIFAEEGEERFRALEREAVRRLAASGPFVIATGGGVVLDPANLRALRESGIIVLLRASPEETLKRVGDARTRPLLADSADPRARVEELLARRSPLYEAAADAVVETTGKTPAESARHVVAIYRERAGITTGAAR